MAGRGWAWTAYDWDEGRLFNYIGDAQNTFPIWNATPLVALDVYEHAYFLDFQTDRASYIEAFFDNLDWGVVNGWVAGYGIPVRDCADARDPDRRRATWPAASRRVLARPGAQGRRHPDASAAATSAATNVWRRYGRWYGLPVDRCSTPPKGFVPALVATQVDGAAGRRARRRARAMLGHWRPLFMRLPEGREDRRHDAAGRSSASRRWWARIGAGVWILTSSSRATRRSPRSSAGLLAAGAGGAARLAVAGDRLRGAAAAARSSCSTGRTSAAARRAPRAG